MSEIKWSESQNQAIIQDGSNVLLSAGAGSGKTAVLTERVYHLVKNGADLNRFLILTFTNAAAAEMKNRIGERISKDKALGDMSTKIATAHIETFDAFALFLVKKYAFRLGVSPNIKIIDNNVLAIKRNNIRDNNITYLYQNKDSDFTDLISCYCVKNDNQIREYIKQICLKAESQIDRKKYLSTFIDTYFNETRIKKTIDVQYQIMLNAINSAINMASELEDPDDADAIIASLNELLEKGTDFDSLLLAVNEYSFPTKSPKSISNIAFRDAIKKKLLGKSLISEKEFGLSKDIIDGYLSTKKYLQTIINIVSQIEDELDAFKQKYNAYSFSDIAALALKALDIPEIRKEMSEYFQYILVDEYQDTSLIQELVINKLGRDNVCMVGDIKQSIYRFRMADCTLFQEKYDSYIKHEGGELINLNTSYRSRKEIVDLVNEMFEKLMTPQNNIIDYKNGHEFEYGFKKYDDLIDDKEDYKLKVYHYMADKSVPAYEAETRLIAQDIINKIQNKYQVYDKKSEGLRNCSFQDFAIIVDRGTAFDDMKAILSSYGIPSRVIYNEPVKDSPVISTLKNLLVLLNSSINDQYDDKFKHSFVAVSRGFLCECKDQEIYNYIKNNNYSDSSLMRRIEKVKKEVVYLPLENKVNALIDEFDFYKNIIKLKRFSNNGNKIELLINVVKGMDEMNFSLDELISYFEDLNNYDLEIDYTDNDVGDDAITIITIHRSKGLEYPIVYMPLLTSKFPSGDKTSFLIDNVVGPVLPLIGKTNKSSFLSHFSKMINAKEDFEERLRLLYVAVTRARERLIMIYRDKENDNGQVFIPSLENNYRALIQYLGLEYKYGVIPETKEKMVKSIKKDIDDKTITLDSVEVPYEKIEFKRASKEKTGEVSDELLEFGNEIHYLLEIVNYETKDLSFIIDPRMKKYIGNVINQDIFKNVKNSQVLHEYSFFDEKNNVHGIIDCLLVKDDEIDIVDFKLKNIDDEKYVLQLHTYRDYISQITSKPIKMYLISAIKGEVKEIE